MVAGGGETGGGVVVQWAQNFSFAGWKSSRDLLLKNVKIVNTSTTQSKVG